MDIVSLFIFLSNLKNCIFNFSSLIIILKSANCKYIYIFIDICVYFFSFNKKRYLIHLFNVLFNIRI